MHRHRSLSTTLPRARTGSRLQPTSPAAPTDQPHHPVPSRPVCRPGSSSLRCRVCSGKVGAAKDAVEQAVLVKVFVGRSDWCVNTMEKKDELDSRHCLRPHRKGAWSAALRRRGVIFRRVFWCRNSSSPVTRISTSCVSLCGVDWLSVRGTAQPERTILPILEVLTYSRSCRPVFIPISRAFRRICCAEQIGCPRGIAATECACPRCSACDQPSPGECPSARRSQPAPVLIDKFVWQPDQVPWYGSSGRADRACPGQAESIHDSEPDLWNWGLDVAGNYCSCVP